MYVALLSIYVTQLQIKKNHLIYKPKLNYND